MKSNEQNALAACADYARANTDIKRLTEEIGNHLDECLGAFQKGDQGGEYQSHLAKAYAFDVVEGDHYYEGDQRVYLSDAEQADVLAECSHCKAAHEAVQARKAARIRLGNAKRQITKIGKASL